MVPKSDWHKLCVGTEETFNPDKIRRLLSKGIITSIANLEKAIFCLEYVGQLQEEGLNFIFKGGSAIQTTLRDRWTRLSIDIDICTDSSREEIEDVLNKIYQKFNGKVFSYKPREKEISREVPFYLYKIETPVITEKSRTILLDIMGMKPKFTTQKTPLKTFFYDSTLKVTTPTIGELLGDKLSTIGSTTIGRPLKDSRNGLEYAKHLFDIKILQETDFDVRKCKTSYFEAMLIQSKIRGKEYKPKECFEDLLFTCQVASLPQRGGEQLIKRLPSSKTSRASSEFQILKDGFRRFRPFLISNVSFTWDGLRTSAARTALLTKILNSNLKQNEAIKILKLEAPKTKEEILALAEQIKRVPEEKRWFMMLEEIVNFPEILRTWHSFFFLNESK